MYRFKESIVAALVASAIGFSSPAVLAMGNSWNDSSEEKLKQAIESVEKKDYVGAINLLKDVLSDDGENADALNYMGYSHRKLGNFENALSYYKKALAIKPDHRGANEYIGEAYLEMKKPDLAKAHLEKLATICGTSCDEYRELKKALDTYMASNKPS